MKAWLAAAIHNKNPLLLQLFDWLCQQAAQKKDFKRELAFQHLYPQDKYEDAKLRAAMFHLLRCIQAFLIYEDGERKVIARQISLAAIYRQRGLDKLFAQAIKKTKAQQAGQSLRNADYYDREFLLHKEENAFIEKQGRTLPMSLQEIGDALEISFVIKKLWQSCLALSHQKVYKTDYHSGMLSMVLEYIEEKNLLAIPSVAIYYHCYKALTEQQTSEHFTQFKNLMVAHRQLFTAPEIRELYLIAINHCIQGINAGKESIYLEEVFSLYRLGVEEAFLLEDGLLSRFTFRNAVFSGLKLKAFDWVFQFIHDYKKHLAERHQKSTFYYCLSRYYYEVGQYQKAMKLLQQFNYGDLISNLAAKTLLAKIYFEHGEDEVLDYFLISFEAFIRRNKIIGYHKDNYLNIIKMMKKLQSIQLTGPAKLEQLSAEIKKRHPLSERKWLLQQLETSSRKS